MRRGYLIDKCRAIWFGWFSGLVYEKIVNISFKK